MQSFHLLVAAFALLQLLRYGRGALLFVVPAVRIRTEPGAEPSTPARLRAAAGLEELGFVPLGTLRETGPLGAVSRELDVHGGDRGVFADVTEEHRGGAAVIELVTTLADGMLVVTSSAGRRAHVAPTAQVVAIPGAAAADLLAAHERAVTRLAATHGAAGPATDLDGRAAASRRWYAGPGRGELRRRHVASFAVAVVAVALLASSTHILLRAPGAR